MGQRISWSYTIKYVYDNCPLLTLTVYRSDMYADPLQLASGVIWTALNIDYPGHSFSHLGIFWGKHAEILRYGLAEKVMQRA